MDPNSMVVQPSVDEALLSRLGYRLRLSKETCEAWCVVGSSCVLAGPQRKRTGFILILIQPHQHQKLHEHQTPDHLARAQ